MSSIISKITKNKYKTLYETELNNRKMYEKRYRELKKQYEDLQKEKGIGDLRKKIMELSDDNDRLKDENAYLKEENVKLKFELEDTQGFLAQEKQAKETLLKERNETNGK